MQQGDSEFLQSLDRSKPYPWMLHAVVNGMRCECCGEVEYPWRPGIFDVHTDGLDELYRHMNFQIVVEVDIEVVAALLNEMGCRVRAGAKYESGDILDDLLAGGYKVRLDLTTDSAAMPVLRIVLPDAAGRWPEDEHCEYSFSVQLAPTQMLRNLDGCGGCNKDT